MVNIFSAEDVVDFINRINKLTPQTKPLWGKMNAGQMLAHVNVSYEMVYEPQKHPKPKGFMKWVLRRFVKKYCKRKTLPSKYAYGSCISYKRQ